MTIKIERKLQSLDSRTFYYPTISNKPFSGIKPADEACVVFHARSQKAEGFPYSGVCMFRADCAPYDISEQVITLIDAMGDFENEPDSEVCYTAPRRSIESSQRISLRLSFLQANLLPGNESITSRLLDKLRPLSLTLHTLTDGSSAPEPERELTFMVVPFLSTTFVSSQRLNSTRTVSIVDSKEFRTKK